MQQSVVVYQPRDYQDEIATRRAALREMRESHQAKMRKYETDVASQLWLSRMMAGTALINAWGAVLERPSPVVAEPPRKNLVTRLRNSDTWLWITVFIRALFSGLKA
jgi:hypothetical protein